MRSIAIIVITAIVVLSMAACASMQIANVDWDSLTGPARVRQYFSISTTEVSVYANYKDESRKEVVFFSTTHDRDRAGVQTVTVTISGQGSGTFQTEVMELTAIRVERPPTKTTYTVGEGANLSGIRVMGSWRDLPDAEVPAYLVEVASFDSRTAGSNRLITVNYKGQTATFPVTVTAAAGLAAVTPAASTPDASQPSRPATQQPAQPTTQQPSQQQPSTSAFNPAPNQPSPVGTWRGSTGIITLNANGTGTMNTSGGNINITWTASGNRLTYSTSGGYTITLNSMYGITGNTLTMQLINLDGTVTGNPIVTFTRQ